MGCSCLTFREEPLARLWSLIERRASESGHEGSRDPFVPPGRGFC